MAAALLGGLLVLLFNVLSCVILIRKSINKSGPGFGYGFIVAMCFTLAFFTLLCGLVLDGFESTVSNQLQKASTWSKYNTGEYIGTIVFSYLCFIMFLFFFLALVIFQGAISEQLGIAASLSISKAYEAGAHNNMESAESLNQKNYPNPDFATGES